jgi:hypothetical protein
MINAAISAGYYLRIVGTMFLRPETSGGFNASGEPELASLPPSPPVTAAIALSVGATLLFGIVLPATNILDHGANLAAKIDYAPTDPARQALPPPVPEVRATDAAPSIAEAGR